VRILDVRLQVGQQQHAVQLPAQQRGLPARRQQPQRRGGPHGFFTGWFLLLVCFVVMLLAFLA